MTVNQIRAFARETIEAAHDAGWHREAFRLSDKLHSIAYRPTDSAAEVVREYAAWLAACLAC